MQTGNVDARILFSACSAILATELAGSFVLAHQAMPALLLTGLARIIEISLILVIVFCLGGGLATIEFYPETLFKKFRRGLYWSAGFGGLALLGLLMLHMTGTYPITNLKTPLPKSPADLILFFLVGGLIAPLAEELFFRGLLYTFLRRGGIILAVGGSTFLFGLAHYFAGNLQLPQIIGGLVFAAAYEIEKHLLVPIVIHILGNLAIFTLGMLV